MKLSIILPCLLASTLNVFTAQSQGFEKINLGFGKATLASFSPNNDVIAFAFGRNVKLFRSGIQVGEIKGHGSSIRAMRFGPQGKLLLTIHVHGRVNIWDIKTKKIVHQFRGEHGLLDGYFLDSPKRIVTVSGKNLTIFDLEGNLIFQRPQEGGNHNGLAVSRNGQMLASFSGHGRISVMDDQGKPLQSFDIKQKYVRRIALDPEGDRLAIASSGGQIGIWDVNSGEWLRTLLETKGRVNSLEFSYDGEYLAVGGESLFLLSVSQEESDVIYKKIYGGVVSASFSYNGRQICMVEDLNTYARVYDISDLNIPPYFQFRDENDLLAPQIYVSNPPKIVNERVNYSQGTISIEGSVFDNYGVQNLIINGIKTPITKSGHFIVHLAMNMGENPVVLQASDVNGNTSTRKFTINRRGEETEYDPLIAQNYLFAVGIDYYKHWPRLNNAVKDANDLAALLMREYNFEFSNITILKDEQASLNNIFLGLRSLIEKVTPQDNLVVYFSGHGYFDELLNEGFWIPVEAETLSAGDYLSNTSILKLLENINSHHTLLIADACFSGSLFTESNRGGGDYLERVGKLRSRWGLASGRLEVVSDGPVGSNSPFALVLLDYLRNPEDSAFAVSELIQYVKMNVAEESGQTPIGNPLRLSGDEGGEFIFRRK